jgi:hypothetical protein
MWTTPSAMYPNSVVPRAAAGPDPPAASSVQAGSASVSTRSRTPAGPPATRAKWRCDGAASSSTLLSSERGPLALHAIRQRKCAQPFGAGSAAIGGTAAHGTSPARNAR